MLHNQISQKKNNGYNTSQFLMALIGIFCLFTTSLFSQNYSELELDSLLAQAEEHFKTRAIDKGFETTDLFLKNTPENSDKYYKGLRLQALLNLVSQKHEEVDSLLDLAERLTIANKDSIFLATLYDTRGSNFMYQSKFEEALTYYIKSLELHKKLNDATGKSKTLMNMVIIYFNLGEYDKMLEYIAQAKSVVPKDNHFMRTNLFKDEALAYQAKGDHEKALELFLKSTRLAEKNDLKQLYPMLYFQTGYTYFKLEDLKKADIFLDKSLELEVDKRNKFSFYVWKAKISALQNNCKEAVSFAEKAKSLKEFEKDKKILSAYSVLISLTKACQGQIDSSYYYINQSKNQNTSFYEQTNFKALQSKEAAYTARIKSDSLKILQLDNSRNEAELRVKNTFLGIGGLILLLLGAGLFFFRKNALQQKKINNILEKADREKSKLFTNIAHELQTPLAIIKGLSNQILKRNNLSAQSKEQTKIILRNSRSMIESTKQILNFASWERSVKEINNYLFQWGDFVNHLLPAFQFLASEKNIELSIKDSKNLDALVYSDIEKLSTIIKNLLSNAIKYTDSGGKISIEFNDNHSFFYEISVEDTGRGIRKEELSTLFDRFKMASNAKEEGGFGIGLALSKEYAELLNGSISVESKIGKGSRFCIKVPKKQAPLNSKVYVFEESRSDLTANLTEKTTSTEIKPQLLIVEDNLDFSRYLKSFLGEEFNLAFAQNGVQALEYLEKTIPDLIISDWMMPEMDGLELAEFLKNSEKYKSIPLLIITARNLYSDELRILQKGVNGFLNKPFEEEVLHEHILNLLNSKETIKENQLLVYDRVSKNFKDKYAIPKNEELISSKENEWLLNFEKVVYPKLKNFDLQAAEIANEMALNINKLNEKIKSLTGFTTKRYIQELRYWEARRMLETREYDSVKAVCISVGLKDQKNFSRNYKERFGMYPKEVLEKF